MKILFTPWGWLLIALFLPIFSIAQITPATPSSIQGLNICQLDTIPIVFGKTNGGTFQASDQFDLSVNLPPFLGFHSAYLPTSQGSVSYQPPSSNSVILSITSNAVDSLSIFLVVDVECGYFSSDPSIDYTLDFSATFNGQSIGPWTRLFEVLKGTLVHSQVTNRNTVIRLGETVTRCFTFINTSTTHAFSGDVYFRDSLEQTTDEPWIEFLDLYALHVGGSYTQLNKSVVDSAAWISIRVTGLPPGDSIVFCDSVRLIDCTGGTPHLGLTLYEMNYGCIGQSPCEYEPKTGSNQTTVVRNGSFRPLMQSIRLGDPVEWCNDTVIHHEYALINTGTEAATGFEFYCYNFPRGTNHIKLTKIDTAGIQVFNSNRMPVTHTRLHNVSYPFLYTHPPAYYIHIDSLIYPGDTIFVFFDEVNTCSDPQNYDSHYNLPHWMFDNTTAAQFTHPCSPAYKQLFDHKRNQYFYLRQRFFNYITTMPGDEELWMEVENQNTLNINNSYINYGIQNVVYYDTLNFIIDIEIITDTGFCIIDPDSLFIVSRGVGDTLRPVWVSTPSVNCCEIDTLQARFVLPPGFFTTHGTASSSYISTYFRQFFSNFVSVFKVKSACCNKISKEKPFVRQNWLVSVDSTCNPICRLPLSSTSEQIAINCPGCLFPGWNLTRFDVLRENVGYADSDNDLYPDLPLTPANPASIDRRQIMIADTLSFDIQAAMSDGSVDSGFVWSSAGFRYTYGVFEFVSPSGVGGLLERLDLLSMEGTLADPAAGWSTQFSADAATLASYPIYFQNNRLHIQFDSLDWRSLGVTDFHEYTPDQTLNLKLTFVVDAPLNAGLGHSQMGMYEVAGKFYISGTPFNLASPQQKPDALEEPLFYLKNNPAVRDSFSYWCTGWDSKVMGVNQSTYASYGYHNIQPYNLCQRQIRYNIYTAAGQAWSLFANGPIYLPALGVFPYEVRNTWMMDSLTLDLPSTYSVEGISFTLANVWKPTGPSKYNAQLMPMQNNIPNTYWQNTGSQLIFYPKRYFEDHPPQPPTPPFDPLTNTHMDGSAKIYQVILTLNADTCLYAPLPTESLSAYTYAKERDEPNLQVDRQLTHSFDFAPNRYEPEWTVQPTPVLVDNGTSDLAFDLNISATHQGGFWGVPNFFIYFESTANGVQITNLQWNQSSYPNPTSSGTHNGNPIYHIGDIGSSLSRFAVNRGGSLHVEASYDCSMITSLKDSIKVYYGYSCDAPVTSLTNGQICTFDSLFIPFEYSLPELDATHITQDTVSACDTVFYVIDLNATLNTRIENVLASFTLPTGVELLAGSRLLFNGADTVFSDAGIGGQVDIPLYEYTSFNGAFIGTGVNAAQLIVPLIFNCEYDLGDKVEVHITSTDFCGKPLLPVALEYQPVHHERNYGECICDPCDVVANFTWCINEGCDLSITDLSTSTLGVTSWYWEVYDSQSGTLLTTSTQQHPMFMGLNRRDLRICLQVVSNNDDECTASLCKEMTLCCVEEEPCVIEADLNIVRPSRCEALFVSQVQFSGISQVNYQWTVTAPSGLQAIYTHTNQTQISLQPTVTGLYRVCLRVYSPDGECEQTICKDVYLRACRPKPCQLEGEIEWRFHERKCTYEVTFSNPPANASYNWTVVNPFGQSMAVTPNPQASTIYFRPTVSGYHYIAVTITWMEGRRRCSKTFKVREFFEACEEVGTKLDGELVWEFDSSLCAYHIVFEPTANASYEWSISPEVDDDNSFTVDPSGYEVTFIPPNPGTYTIRLLLKWRHNGKRYEEVFEVDISHTSCGTSVNH